MKKLFYIILFSLCICSCSKDDDDIYVQPVDNNITNPSIVGTWKDKDYGETFIFGEDKVKLITMTGDVIDMEYVFTGEEIIITEYIYIDNSESIAKCLITKKKLEEEVKSARGERMEAILDQIVEINLYLAKLYSEQRNEKITYHSTVTKFTFNELSFYIDDTEYNLTRIND